MLQHITFCCYFSTLIAVNFAHNQIANPFSFEIDQCKDICSDSFFLLPLSKDSQVICQRGCRFFNIIDIKEERNLNDTNKECHLSCAESYTSTKAQGSCTVGCDTMSKKKQSDLHKFFPYFEQYNTDEQEFDSLEADILLDPLIRKQVQMGYDLQYKIPEAYIRTMPIDDNGISLIEADDIAYKQYKNRLFCSSIIPVTIFVIILFGLVMCTLKIVQLVQAIKNHKAAIARGELLNDAEEYESFLNTSYRYFGMYDVPRGDKLADENKAAECVIVRT